MINLLNKINFQQNRKIILIVGVALLGSVVLFFLANRGFDNLANKKIPFTIAAYGNLPSLDEAIKKDSIIKAKIDEILSYDVLYLFTNYSQVDNQITDILFLWVGFTPEQITTKDRQDLVEVFIRRTYQLPKDEPIKNNPLLKKNPWIDLFNYFKARILMQGNGYKVYKGKAYFDGPNRKMMIEGKLSENFIKELTLFINNQSEADRKKYKNNFLVFINETKGFKNLNEEEKLLLKQYGFI